MYLIYLDSEDNRHEQWWTDVAEDGCLIDPETGEDMPLLGWRDDGGNITWR